MSELDPRIVEALRPLARLVADNLPRIEAVWGGVVNDMTAKAEKHANEGDA